jgi:hypothetical protein
MTGIPFQGAVYNDDRMFVLYVCKCTIRDGDNDTVATTIHHDLAPSDHKWCVVTYKNIATYPAVRVDHFESLKEAHAYIEQFEPMVPLISLGGRSPSMPLSYAKFVEWKVANHMREYDYTAMYLPGGQNHCETILSQK